MSKMPNMRADCTSLCSHSLTVLCVGSEEWLHLCFLSRISLSFRGTMSLLPVWRRPSPVLRSSTLALRNFLVVLLTKSCLLTKSRNRPTPKVANSEIMKLNKQNCVSYSIDLNTYIYWRYWRRCIARGRVRRVRTFTFRSDEQHTAEGWLVNKWQSFAKSNYSADYFLLD